MVSLQIWRQLFSPLHALNFGVGGDATQHVLWRLSNGELDNISPKVQSITKNREHDRSFFYLFTVDWLCLAWLCSGYIVLTLNYQCRSQSWILSSFVVLGCRAVGGHEQPRSHSWTDLWRYYGYCPSHQEQVTPCPDGCTGRFFFCCFFSWCVPKRKCWFTHFCVRWKWQMKFIQKLQGEGKQHAFGLIDFLWKRI